MRAATAFFLCLAALPAAAGNVYKWTDSSGQVHFSQTPPPNRPATAQEQKTLQPGVSLQAPPAPPPAQAAAAKPAEVAAAPETKEAKTKRCAASKERVQFLEEHPPRRLMVKQADGSEARMTEEQFDQQVTKAREAGKGC